MVAAETPLPVSYFGKLPTRGDFVRTSESHPLMVLLDRWAGHGVELLAQDPGWKQLYDEAQPVSFDLSVASPASVRLSENAENEKRAAKDDGWPAVCSTGTIFGTYRAEPARRGHAAKAKAAR